MTTQIHECHQRDTKEQLYDVRLHDVELHDVANTCFADAYMKTNFKKIMHMCRAFGGICFTKICLHHNWM